jgi:ligand-binding sensor protein
MTRCDTCGSGAFWTSKTGARVCYRCHPAADDALTYLAVETRRVGCDLAALRQQIADRFNEPVTFGPPTRHAHRADRPGWTSAADE